MDTLIERVGALVEMSPEEIMERGKERMKVEAQYSLLLVNREVGDQPKGGGGVSFQFFTSMTRL